MIPKVHGATTSRSRPAGPTDGIGMEFIGASHIDDKGRPPIQRSYTTRSGCERSARACTNCCEVQSELRGAQ